MFAYMSELLDGSFVIVLEVGARLWMRFDSNAAAQLSSAVISRVKVGICHHGRVLRNKLYHEAKAKDTSLATAPETDSAYRWSPIS